MSQVSREELAERMYKELVGAWLRSHYVEFDVVLKYDGVAVSAVPVAAGGQEYVEICEQCGEGELLRIRGAVHIPAINEDVDMLADALAGMAADYPDYACYIGTLLFLGVRDVRVRRFGNSHRQRASQHTPLLRR